ncbi:MAG: hypothetical protein WDO14_14730 [Bacteroidota bacterium]
MTELIDKSQQNIEAALALRTSLNLLAPSVHCAYYSCVQLMIDILIHDFEIPDDEIIDEAKAHDMGTHEFASSKIFMDLKSKKEFQSANNFNNTVGRLRRKRNLADYKLFTVTPQTSKNAYEEALIINTILKKHYNIED